mgnify:CR=1 FL=1
MEIGEIISGYGDQYGITLQSISEITPETSAITTTIYEPEDANFAWAVDQLALLD